LMMWGRRCTMMRRPVLPALWRSCAAAHLSMLESLSLWTASSVGLHHVVQPGNAVNDAVIYRSAARFLSTLPPGFLSYETLELPNSDTGSGKIEQWPTVAVLHGFLGSGKNFRSFAQMLGRRHLQQSTDAPGVRIVLVDLRNHGSTALRAGDFGPPHTVAACAWDVLRLVAHLQLGPSEGVPPLRALVGHSFGGKVALEVSRILEQPPWITQHEQPRFGVPSEALAELRDSLRQVWVLDMSPSVARDADPLLSNDDVASVLRALRALPWSIPSRKWFIEQITAQGMSETLGQWLATSLTRAPTRESKEAMRFVFDLDVAQEMLASHFATDCWPYVEQVAASPGGGSQLHLVQAMGSSRWSTGDVARLRELLASQPHDNDSAMARLFLHQLANTGHWLHAENPSGLAELMLPCLGPALH